MEPYDTGCGVGPFAASRTSFEALVTELEGPVTAQWTHDRLEELIETSGREVLRCLLQDHLDLRAVREEADLATRLRAGGCPAGRNRMEHGHSRTLATVVGPVTVRRCALRAPGEPNIYPADAALSLPAVRHSHGLRKQAVLEAVRSSYDTTHAAISRRCGPVAGKRQLEGLVVAAAADIDAFYASAIPEPVTASTLLVLSADSKGIVMRPDSLREPTRRTAAHAAPVFRTRLASGEKPNRKRMATLAVVYDADPAPRRPHDVICVGGARTGDRQPRPGPRARGTWLTGSVTKTAGDVITDAFTRAQARDPTHTRVWVVLVDGARHQLDLIQAEAARRRAVVHIVLDFVHVLERLWTAAWCFHTHPDPAVEDWVAVRAVAILSGHANAVAEAITTQADAAGLAPDRREGADVTARYLRNNLEFLHYDTALAAGWPIATGVIESACRHLVQDRLDIGGARWGLPGAEAVLTLRALIDNGSFDDYWKYHLAQEHRRVHPNDHQLAA